MWIKEGFSVRQLQRLSSHSRDKLYRLINKYLDDVPIINTGALSQHKHLIFDGTFIFKRKENAICLMDALSGKVIHGTTNVSESSFPKMYTYFKSLKDRGLNPHSITVDGHPCIIKTIEMLWPNTIIQRCIVHVQRQGLMWCRINPKRTDAKKLRKLFSRLSYIFTHKDVNLFMSELINWEIKYGKKIENQPEKGWVFSDLKRARSMLLRALPNMFHFIHNDRIPKSSNMIEGYFSRAKKSYRNHQGLAPRKRSKFFLWHMYFNSK